MTEREPACEEYDFIVVGSGAGALTAAIRAHGLGLSTLVIEKSEYFGGSSAMSGGGLWIPNNHDMPRAGVADTDAEAISYLKTITEGKVSDAKIRAYVTRGHEVIASLQQCGILKTSAIGNYPDYYPAVAGAKPGGRTMEALTFNALRLGKERHRLRPTQLLMLGVISGIASQASENIKGTRKGQWLFAKRLLLWALNIPARLISKQSLMLGLGQALVAPLRLALMKRNVPLWYNTAATKLVVENSRVTGIEVEQHGTRKILRARKGVLLAAGGFDHNEAMRQQHLPKPTSHLWSAGNVHNTGDAIVMGEQIGAKLAFMDEAWWTPTLQVPDYPVPWILLYEKNMPHGIYVDSSGKRFVNEAAPYTDVIQGMYRNHGTGHESVPCYMIFDAQYRQQSAIGKILPGKFMPDSKINPDYWGKILFKANTLDELARQIHIPAENLQRTITRFNQFAVTGIDEDFHRGENISDRFFSKSGYKNPNLGAVIKAPFYAAKVEAGDLGTKGGLDTNEHAQVLREDGTVIAGLYACGNCASPVMGNSYAGAGSTLGPAMVFGVIAAEIAANSHASPMQ
jgi:3-oxosteroid 1-dehydrogenase